MKAHTGFVAITKSAGHCIVLYWWGGYCCPMHCDLFKIYCAPPNLGITRTWIRRLISLRGLYFQAWGSSTSLKSQTRDPQHKVSPGGLLLRIFKSWKNASTSAGFEPANLGSRDEHVTLYWPSTLRTVDPKITLGLFHLETYQGTLNTIH